jgi:hypothetical protein
MKTNAAQVAAALAVTIHFLDDVLFGPIYAPAK